MRPRKEWALRRSCTNGVPEVVFAESWEHLKEVRCHRHYPLLIQTVLYFENEHSAPTRIHLQIFLNPLQGDFFELRGELAAMLAWESIHFWRCKESCSDHNLLKILVKFYYYPYVSKVWICREMLIRELASRKTKPISTMLRRLECLQKARNQDSAK